MPSGALLAFALFAWVSAAFAAAAFAASWLPRRWAFGAAPLLLTVLVAVPFVDEARAKVRFQKLCGQRATLRTLAPPPEGVRLVAAGQHELDHRTGPLAARETLASYVPEGGTRAAIQYSTLTAAPGWFVRALAGDEPMLYRGACAPADLSVFLARQAKPVQVARAAVPAVPAASQPARAE